MKRMNNAKIDSQYMILNSWIKFEVSNKVMSQHHGKSRKALFRNVGEKER